MPFNKRKAFGQHFLVDAEVIQKILAVVQEAIVRHPDAAVLEVGPGEGALTRPLLQMLPIEKKFYLAERDQELIKMWRSESRVEKILEGDFAATSLTDLEKLGPLVVVSNLPYSAATAIVTLLADWRSVAEMVLMFQSEVAQRLYAEPSTPDRGSLSLFIQNIWDVQKKIEVSPRSFKPPPRVMSEVVHLRRRSTPWIELRDERDHRIWSQLLKSSFQHRRKMLRGNLKAAPFQTALQKSGIDPTKRAESLDWTEWRQLWAAVRPEADRFSDVQEST